MLTHEEDQPIYLPTERSKAGSSRDIASGDQRAKIGNRDFANFNSALDLSRRFDSTLRPVESRAELERALVRLASAMKSAYRQVPMNRSILTTFANESGVPLSSKLLTIIEDTAALAQLGSKGLIDIGADHKTRAESLDTLNAYVALSDVALAVPRLRDMCKFLVATGLIYWWPDEESDDRRVSKLAKECKLLFGVLNPAGLADRRGAIDLLEARFQRFRWSYAEHYALAHARWRIEMGRFVELLEEARLHELLIRGLDSIQRSQDENSSRLEAKLDQLSRSVIHCDVESLRSVEVIPRCVVCEFKLGDWPQSGEALALLKETRREFKAKVANFGKTLMARLVRLKSETAFVEAILGAVQSFQPVALQKAIQEYTRRRPLDGS
jgi:hypothetical protein